MMASSWGDIGSPKAHTHTSTLRCLISFRSFRLFGTFISFRFPWFWFLLGFCLMESWLPFHLTLFIYRLIFFALTLSPLCIIHHDDFWPYHLGLELRPVPIPSPLPSLANHSVCPWTELFFLFCWSCSDSSCLLTRLRFGFFFLPPLWRDRLLFFPSLVLTISSTFLIFFFFFLPPCYPLWGLQPSWVNQEGTYPQGHEYYMLHRLGLRWTSRVSALKSSTDPNVTDFLLWTPV